MVTASISRGATSVDIQLRSSDTNALAVARDIGKPNANVFALGRQDPRIGDHFSAQDQFTVIGVIQGSSAYADAKTLAEDLIKPIATDGTPLQLDLSNLPSGGTHDVAPIPGSALQLEYRPGIKDTVGVQLSLPTVSQTISGGASLKTQTYSSPDAGSGVKVETSGGGTSVTIPAGGLQVTRTVARPPTKKKAGTIPTPNATRPKFYDLQSPSFDQFNIRGRLTGANAESDANTLEESLIRPLLGYDNLNLHFLGGLWNLDQYPVMPTSSQALRTTFSTGEKGVIGIETLKLRVVDQS